MTINILLSIFVAVGGQSAPVVAAPPQVTHHWGPTFVSPMGEPFHADRGGDAMAIWFAQADRNHDGYLTVDELQGDAERFFATLDTNHDGEIDPDELDHYERVIAPQIWGASDEPREAETHQGASRFGLLDLPEPVASADADFNRGVSLEEFRQAAAQRFAALDLDHRGRLSLAELEIMRPPPAATPHKSDQEPDIDTGSVP